MDASTAGRRKNILAGSMPAGASGDERNSPVQEKSPTSNRENKTHIEGSVKSRIEPIKFKVTHT